MLKAGLVPSCYGRQDYGRNGGGAAGQNHQSLAKAGWYSGLAVGWLGAVVLTVLRCRVGAAEAGAELMITPNPTATAITLATRRRNVPVTLSPLFISGRYNTVSGAVPP